MKIAVLLKQTPDTEAVVRLSEDGRSIVTDDFKWIINPYDEFAVEAALRMKDKHGGEVVLVSQGPQRVAESMRTAFAMGADHGVLIDDEALEGGDSLGVAKALAAAIRELAPDMVLCGRRAIDYDLGQRGPMVAELLGWPHVGPAVSLDSDGCSVTIDRAIEDGVATLQADFPVLVTFGGSHGVWNPRYASLPGIMKANKKPLAIRKLGDLGLRPEGCGGQAAKISFASLELPPPRAGGRILDGGMGLGEKARELVRVLREEAGVL